MIRRKLGIDHPMLNNKIFLFLVTFLFFQCNQDQDIPSINEISSKLVAYDQEGSEQSMFESGANIKFSLVLVNHANREIELGNYYDYCTIYNFDDFLKVYKFDKNQINDDEKWKLFGKAYIPPVNCLTVNLPFIVPSKSETIVAGCAWNSNTDNPPFNPGEYYTAMHDTVFIEDHKFIFNLELHFKVQ